METSDLKKYVEKMGVPAQEIPRGCHRQLKKTPASLGYPQSIFKKTVHSKGSKGFAGHTVRGASSPTPTASSLPQG